MHRRSIAVVGPMLALALIVGCSLDPDFVMAPRGWSAVQLSRDGVDSFRARLEDDTMAVAAADRNAATNSRMILLADDATSRRDTEACISFSDEGWPAQEGIALRVDTDADDRTRAITVMKNVWAHAESSVNVLLWDTATPTAPQTIDSYVATSVKDGDGFAPNPWSMCARTAGDDLTYMMWPSDQPQPSWDDMRTTRRTKLPESVPTSGTTGLYVGHVPPEATVQLTMLSGFD